METPSVQILLSTYNGQAFLEAQLRSVLEQNFKDWQLLVRDDGSQDRTLEILNSFAKNDSRVRILGASKNLGAIQSFAALMQESTASLVFFCDQDDFWHPNKMSRLLETARAIEAEQGADLPVAVHSDMRVVGESGQVLDSSFRRRMGFRNRASHFFELLAQNDVTGCTMLVNRALIKEALPIPKEALMHDQWIALLASALGRLECVNETLIDYRHHSQNLSGGLGRETSGRKILSVLFGARAQRMVFERLQQSFALKERLRERHPKSERLKELEDFHQSLANPLSFLNKALEKKLRAQGFARTALFYLALAKNGKKIHAQFENQF